MQKDSKFVNLCILCKFSASNSNIGTKDHISIQINLAKVTGQHRTYAICDTILRMKEPDDSTLRLARNNGNVSKNF
ncbi:small ribosomal subunit protein eS21-like [Eleutherodactylus coqui]|uniref:Uncharacterized protein n=1 Tax=Eleutherodactylus coqui TaxID=57060 RepID=A0A8J6FJK1_ELECQ|nr:hypothetical protein GDO78_007742 [Eleutherodactylus coqui]